MYEQLSTECKKKQFLRLCFYNNFGGKTNSFFILGSSKFVIKVLLDLTFWMKVILSLYLLLLILLDINL